ncbi:MAG: TetM/TetW/TetO/TetS family tetracycline resistance ribosomal protection protein [Mogibacterium sp.]|nr:TetM/TetW/TetO/TetS family tetracycline resistance ribosomal protection protein [Mogibacterium sp.]
MDTKKITLGILAHVDAGKTTLSEALLYLTGEIRKPGRVDHGDAFLDDDPIERNRGITIFSRQARFTIKGAGDADTEVTLIDTPGHVDFAAEMERSLSVLDYALLVISGSEGVQAHTKTLCRLLKERGIPVFAFVNKMDIAVRKKEDILKELASELDAGLVDFSGADMRTEEFTDAVTLYSPELAETVLEGNEISDDELADAVASGELIPCMFGSALKMEGVEQLLEVLGRYTREPERGDGFGARIFKTAASDDGERLCFIKVTGGELKVKDKVRINSASGDADGEEKVNRIMLFSGSRSMPADSAAAGTVCAVTGLSQALPGDGLGAEPPLAGTSIKPFMVYSVKGPEGMDPYLLMKDLRLLAEEDPMLNVSLDSEGNIDIRLMGQVQLEVLQSIIKDRFGYDVSFGSGNVLYLETVSGKYEGVGHFEPLRHYAEVHLIIEPGERGSGTVITSSVPEDELALNWQRLIMTHLYEREHAGVLTGAPLTDVRITLAAGRAHEKHTVGGDFREATYRAVRNALMQARAAGRAVLLEPWCEYEIELPARSVGRAMTDIRQMGGSQDTLEQAEDTAKIKGRVPASEISGYQLTLSGYTSGEGRLSCTPCGYDECHDAAAVIEEKGYDPERDVDNPADSVFVNHSGSDIVKWDEVTEHMHIGSVLKSKAEVPSYGRAVQRNAGGSASPDVKEEAKRRIAAEKELRSIFERTYGTSKKTRRRDVIERDYRNRPELSEEEAARNAVRNQEIKARREHKTEKREEKPVMVLIDGYNIIFADDYLKDLFARDGGSARDQLLDRLSNYAGYTGFEVTVVFDAYNVSSSEAREEDRNGVKVVFTAENEPADIRMGVMTSAARDRQIYVVSSDSLVQTDAWAHGAFRISSREFLGELTRIEEEIRDHLRRGD